jgi:hypothetical protein
VDIQGSGNLPLAAGGRRPGMPHARSQQMRRSILALLLVVPSFAHAGSTGGGGGSGGGRLGQVSGGIGSATHGGSGSGGSNASSNNGGSRDGTIVRRVRPHPQRTGGTARVDLFLGAQKVFESDGSFTAGLALEDRWFRLAGSVTRYHEGQMGPALTMTMPTLTAGIRIDDHRGATRAFLEGGVAVAQTQNDPMVDSSITGPIAGVHVEHSFGPGSVIGDAHAMWFEAGVRAYAGRVGVRIRHLELALRVLDFNVGPALYGPEVGISF